MRLFHGTRKSSAPAVQPDNSVSPITENEAEKQDLQRTTQSKTSVYAGLGWLDRLLALWILLAIVIGILLGNFVDGVEEALQRGKFVNVSVPIGMLGMFTPRVCVTTNKC